MTRGAFTFFVDIYAKRSILFELTKRDFQQQYMGSYLGFFWVFLQPLLFVVVIATIFSIGLRGAQSVEETPFVVYLLSGIVPWFYIAESLNRNTKVIKQHSFLLKKVDFRLSMLPMVSLMSSLAPHIFLIFVSIIVLAFHEISLSFYIVQLLYYFLAMSCLLLGVAWLTSSTQLFIPDVGKVMGLVVSFGFWLTPIFWSIDSIPTKYQWLINLNPFSYIVQGYRDSLYLDVGFWEKPQEAFWFWLIALSFLALGTLVFKRLRPHFAEVA